MNYTFFNEFCADNARDYRAKQRGKIIPYGIKFLDRALSGIRPTDLVFIGARTGAGKTEFATMLAQNTARMGKQVYYFALEADRGEIENRIVYRAFAKLYYANTYFASKPPINYRDFADGVYDSQFIRLIEEAEKLADKKMMNINIIYRQEGFTADDFEAHVHNIKDYADLLILDHVHHFDIETDRETTELKKIIKKLRDISIIVEKPIVCIAHLRKTDRRTQELAPDIEEFYGSSEISKEATQIITLAPVSSEVLQTEMDYNLSPTLFRIPKFRRFSPVSKYLGLMLYNNQTNSYMDKFSVYKLKNAGTELESVEDIPAFLQEKGIREVQDGLME